MKDASEFESRVEYEQRRVRELEAAEPLAASTLAHHRREICRVIELCQGDPPRGGHSVGNWAHDALPEVGTRAMSLGETPRALEKHANSR